MLVSPSKLTTYQECKRKYVMKYILNWQPASESTDIVYGRAWHSALEFYWRAIANMKMPRKELMMKVFSDVFGQAEPTERKCKETAELGIDAYIDEFLQHDVRCEVLAVEAIGEAPLIREDVFIEYRIDTIIKDYSGVYVLEHKTTGVGGWPWVASWQLSHQAMAYTHVARCLYDEESEFMLDLMLIKSKKSVSLSRTPIFVDTLLDSWLLQVEHIIDQIEEETDALEDEKNSSDLRLFERNPASCNSYGRLCEYFDICSCVSNPFHLEHLPVGMQIVNGKEKRDDEIQRVSSIINEALEEANNEL